MKGKTNNLEWLATFGLSCAVSTVESDENAKIVRKATLEKILPFLDSDDAKGKKLTEAIRFYLTCPTKLAVEKAAEKRAERDAARAFINDAANF